MKKLLIAATFFATATVIAGPLGLSKGMTLQELKKQGTFAPSNEPFIYTAKKIANGHPDFESYTVIVTPEQGLCKMQALSKDIETSSFGTELESKYQTLTNALSEKYGTPTKNYDFLRAGSIWKDSQDWMMGLLKKERTLTAFWINEGNTNFPDSIKSIKVETVALSGSKGYIILGYEFDNLSECMATLKAKQNSNL